MTSTGFITSTAEDSSKSITVNYLPMGLSQIEKVNDVSSWCQPTSSSNVTFNVNNVATEYKADRLWIIGSNNNAVIHQINGVSDATNELIIRNKNANGDKTLYMCYLLKIVTAGSSDSQIDAIFNKAIGGGSNNTLTVDLNSAISQRSTPDAKYIEYTSSLGSDVTVILYSTPLDVLSVGMHGLSNDQTNSFDWSPTDYNIIGAPAPGDWMECDYVPIDSEEVTTYNLPLNSGVIGDASASSSLKTMIMFILFMVFTGISYTAIPLAYRYLVEYIFKFMEKVNPVEQRQFLGKIDAGLAFFIGVTAVILLYLGAFTDYTNAPMYLLVGMCMGIAGLLSYIILQSKKSLIKDWPIYQINRDAQE